MAWPSIDNPSGIEETFTKAQHRTQFEDGTVQSRAKHTSARSRWRLTWSSLPAADLASLKTFFAANQGATFSWTHPATAAGYTVRFSEDSIQAVYVPVDRYQVTVAIEEA